MASGKSNLFVFNHSDASASKEIEARLNRVSISFSLGLGLVLGLGLGLVLGVVLGLVLGLVPSGDIVLKSTVLSSSCVPIIIKYIYIAQSRVMQLMRCCATIISCYL